MRHDPIQTTPEPTAVTAPERFEAEGLAQTDLRRELRWYLEHFLDYPFSPNIERADRLLDALKAWGTHAFEALLGAGKGRDFYHDAVRDGPEQLQLRITANDPLVLAWPWEALHDPERGYLAHHCHIERQLNNVADPPPLPENLPRDRLNILLVTARPFEHDIQYRSISRALVELIDNENLAAKVTVLRPPTFDALRSHLHERPGYYHIVHFDGHGGYGVIADNPSQAAGPAQTVSPHSYQGPQGCLVFETASGEPDPIPADTLSATLHEFRIPMVVLNACQSAAIDERAENAFASVAASLIRAGIRSVVAMAYSLYVSGAQHFLPAFYRRLLETGNPAEPARAGRQAMLTHAGRVCARGTHPLQDWLVPVVYQQQPMDFSFAAKRDSQNRLQPAAPLPEEVAGEDNPYGFIGRDGAILAMERALLRDAPAVLIHGLGGVGKTTLAGGFVRWLSQTEGLGAGCFWLAFNDIHSAEFVLNRLGEPLFGSQFNTLDKDKKIEALSQSMRDNRMVIVWDNFESASGNDAAGIDPLLGADDLQLLRQLLSALRGGKTKVIITSRSEESWLAQDLRYKLSLGGLIGEERWEFCTVILRNLGLKVNRDDPDMVELMDLLDGHPLLMRAVLPRLEGARRARAIIDELRGNLGQLDPAEDQTQEKVNATLRFVEDGLPEELRPLLVPLALHERFADTNMLEEMAKRADQSHVDRAQIDRLMAALSTAGLVRDRAKGVIYELHPALTGFLRSTVLRDADAQVSESWTRAFVDVMGSLANSLAPRPLHEQRGAFQVHRPNFHAALSHAERLDMEDSFAQLTQSLATYAQNTWNLDIAERLYQRLAEHQRARGKQEVEAAAYHQLGIITQERRDLETAEKWYLKSLQINEKLGNEADASATYHQLGIIAAKQRDFETAEKWYSKSLGICEKLGNEAGAASTYHELGTIDQEQHDFDAAEKWYLKSLEIKEKLGNEVGASTTYHQLGRSAQGRRDFGTAEKWYLKSLQISEKIGNEIHAASTYNQLGMITQEQGGFETAEKWYLKSLQINEKLGNEAHAADTYGQLGTLAGLQGRFIESGRWLVKSVQASGRCRHPAGVERNTHNFMVVLKNASEAERAEMMKMWRQAGLGVLPPKEKGAAEQPTRPPSSE
jgi:tetratricopeptide (TPR) repeat protein